MRLLLFCARHPLWFSAHRRDSKRKQFCDSLFPPVCKPPPGRGWCKTGWHEPWNAPPLFPPPQRTGSGGGRGSRRFPPPEAGCFARQKVFFAHASAVFLFENPTRFRSHFHPHMQNRGTAGSAEAEKQSGTIPLIVWGQPNDQLSVSLPSSSPRPGNLSRSPSRLSRATEWPRGRSQPRRSVRRRSPSSSPEKHPFPHKRQRFEEPPRLAGPSQEAEGPRSPPRSQHTIRPGGSPTTAPDPVPTQKSRPTRERTPPAVGSS